MARGAGDAGLAAPGVVPAPGRHPRAVPRDPLARRRAGLLAVAARPFRLEMRPPAGVAPPVAAAVAHRRVGAAFGPRLRLVAGTAPVLPGEGPGPCRDGQAGRDRPRDIR